MANQPIHAPAVWAQRKDQIFLSFNVSDIQDPKISVESNKLTFSGVSHGVKYHNELEFTGEIDPSKSKYAVHPRTVDFVLARKEPGSYWSHLNKDQRKVGWLTVDWNKWIDEDELDEKKDKFDIQGMGGLDFGGQEEDEDEDE